MSEPDKKLKKEKSSGLKKIFTSQCSAENMVEEIPPDVKVDLGDSSSEEEKDIDKSKLNLSKKSERFASEGKSQVFFSTTKKGKELKIGVRKNDNLFWVGILSSKEDNIWFSESGGEVFKKLQELKSKFSVEDSTISDIKMHISILNMKKKK